MIDSSGLMWGWTGTAAAGSSATPAENRRLRPAGYRVLSSERHRSATLRLPASSRLSTSLSGPRVCLFAVTGYKIVTARALDATDNPQPVTLPSSRSRASSTKCGPSAIPGRGERIGGWAAALRYANRGRLRVRRRHSSHLSSGRWDQRWPVVSAKGRGF